MKRTLRVLAAFLIGVYCVAATPPTPAPTRVTLMLTDNKSIAGELIAATPAGVTIRQTPKAELITKKWSEIKRAGNGLTREKVLAEYRKDRADQLCAGCKGDATEACKACEGKSVTAASAKPCDKCGGAGFSGPCRTPKCKEGKLPCAADCLKPTDFSGPPGADGKRWKKIPGKGKFTGGFATVSDAHIGELVVFQQDGQPSLAGKCPTCNGTSVIADAACHGTGKAACKTCKAHGVLGDCQNCDDGKGECQTCHGSGMKVAAAG